MNKTEKIEVAIIIILIIIFCSTIIYAKNVDKKVDSEKIDNTVSPLKDVNRYFSIDSAISKYISYVESQDKSAILKILNSKYIKDNQITTDNLFNYITAYETTYKSNTREIYQVSKHDNIYKYYAKVRINNELLDSSNFVRFDYFEITIDEENLTFAIEPISSIIYQDKIGEVTTNE